jgi:sterol regulatory element-binding transcription factor 1
MLLASLRLSLLQVLACKHLPAGLLASPGERAGRLIEAARMLERLGDRRRLAEVASIILPL